MEDPCASLPCQNNATCIADTVLHQYTCNCTEVTNLTKPLIHFIKLLIRTITVQTASIRNHALRRLAGKLFLLTSLLTRKFSYGGTCIENDDGTTSCLCLQHYTGATCDGNNADIFMNRLFSNSLLGLLLNFHLLISRFCDFQTDFSINHGLLTETKRSSYLSKKENFYFDSTI